MNKKLIILIVLGVLVLLLSLVFTSYNSLVRANEAVNNQWAQVENQLQRRFDLIPNLVESVKGIMQQEQKIFSDLAQARTKYANAQTVDEKTQAAGAIEGALARLLAIMENYPQLKSAENIQTLMIQLEGTENRIAVERRRFNDSVKNFNVMVKIFPTNILAHLFGFKERTYFESVENAENPPKVNL